MRTPGGGRITATTNLRRRKTDVVGRERELRGLIEAFGDGNRVVTLVGPPGIGKTRLAESFALTYHRAASPEGGAWLCDLAVAESLRDVIGIVAGVLGVPLDASKDAGDVALARALAGRGETLLVLDNLEGVVDATRGPLEAWLEAAPELRVLITSREVAGIADELRVELGPLAPADGLALLEARARAHAPSFRVTPDNAAAAEALVRKLDALPLAIELAAGRLAVLSLEELSARVAQSFEVLRAAGRPGDARHQTLRAAIESSWAALDPYEQRALRQCAVFHGGLTVEAAEAVLDPGTGAPPVIDLLQALREKSLLTQIGGASARLALYESIRQYAEERLGHGEERDAVEARHTRHFVEAGERWAGALRSANARTASANLAADEPNLLAAYRRSAHADPSASVRAALALDAHYVGHGPWERHAEVLDGALVVCPDGAPALRCRVLLARAELLRRRGAGDDAMLDADRALELARRTGDGALASDSLRVRGLMTALTDGPEAAESALRSALDAARAAGARSSEVRALHDLGWACQLTGRTDEARAHGEAAARLARVIDDRQQLALARVLVAVTEADRGELARAEGLIEGALALYRETGNRSFEAGMWTNLGCVRLDQRRHEDAMDAFEGALEIARTAGLRHHEVAILTNLGITCHLLGRADEAERRLREAVAAGSASDGLAAKRWALLHLGALEALAGRPETLRRARADVVRESTRSLAAVADVLEGFVEIGEGRIDDARRRLGEAPGHVGPEGRVYAVRVAVRCLEAAVAATTSPSAAGLAPPPASSPNTLEVALDGSWLRPSGGARVDLVRRGALRRVLGALASAARASRQLGVAELIEAGWPGERVNFEAGSNRVYVAVATLRRLGLGEHLLKNDDGYRLTAAVAIASS